VSTARCRIAGARQTWGTLLACHFTVASGEFAVRVPVDLPWAATRRIDSEVPALKFSSIVGICFGKLAACPTFGVTSLIPRKTRNFPPAVDE
jgi:hypothetical protein